MHDLKAIRRDPELFAAQMARRGIDASTVEALKEADKQARAGETAVGNINALRRQNSEAFGRAKRLGEPPEALVLEGKRLGVDAVQAEEIWSTAYAARDTIVLALPNILQDIVPDGRDDSANVVMHVDDDHDDILPGVEQCPHWETGPALGMDAQAGTLLSGSRATVLRGPLARLERVLGQWMLDVHVNEHGYEEVSVPHMVRHDIMRGTGQLPKFADDLFQAGENWLIPTAEVPLTNLARLWSNASKPYLRLAALTPCYRAEAGAAGRDTRGMLRQHQFNKVEMVSVVPAKDAVQEHARMLNCAETILKRLGLTWRRVLLCAGDTGFSATITYDLEVWMAGTKEWREIASISDCGTFQARRMGLKGELPHTLNGSGVAVGRALVALLENCVDGDGTLHLPPPLSERMGVQSLSPDWKA